MEIFLPFILLISVCVGVIIAYKFPLFTVFLLFVTGMSIRIFSSTRFFDEEYSLIGLGVRAEDIVMVSMAIAVFIRVFFTNNIKNYLRTTIGKISLFLFLWLMWETIRNITLYGISAPGESVYI